MLNRIVRFILRVSRSIEFHYNRNLRKKQIRQFLRAVQPETMTLYPQVSRKSDAQIKEELYCLLLEDKGSWSDSMTLTQYFQFGCDRASVDVGDYVFQKEYDIVRNRLNGRLASLYDYKNVAGVYLKACGIEASCALGQIAPDAAEITLKDGSRHKLDTWLQQRKTPVFCKPNDGCQGKSCYRMEWNQADACVCLNGENYLLQDVAPAVAGHIVEPLIVQHRDLRCYSPNCVNPLRIRTICIAGEIRLVSIYICIAAAGAYWSNGASCGVIVGIDETGRCITDGFCEVPGMEGRYQTLPGTDTRLSELVIPGVKEAIELAKAAHRTTPQIFAIGWDVAVTDDGPIIIEGNPDYGTCTYQSVSGIGERRFFETEFQARLKK